MSDTLPIFDLRTYGALWTFLTMLMRTCTCTYVFRFSRYTSRRGSYRSPQLSNCAGFGLLYIKHCHVAWTPFGLSGSNCWRIPWIWLAYWLHVWYFANFWSSNLWGALDFPDHVNAYLYVYVNLNSAELPGLLTLCCPRRDSCPPLNTVGIRDSKERRVIVDLSWPCRNSVNDGIPSDSYLVLVSITLSYNR